MPWQEREKLGSRKTFPLPDGGDKAGGEWIIGETEQKAALSHACTEAADANMEGMPCHAMP